MPTLCSLFIEWSALVCFDVLFIMHFCRHMIVMLSLMCLGLFFMFFVDILLSLILKTNLHNLYIYLPNEYAYLHNCMVNVILTTWNITDLFSFLSYKVWFLKDNVHFVIIIKQILYKLFMDWDSHSCLIYWWQSFFLLQVDAPCKINSIMIYITFTTACYQREKDQTKKWWYKTEIKYVKMEVLIPQYLCK